MKEYYEFDREENIDNLARSKRIIALNGSKCSGKSTIADLLVQKGYGFSVNFFGLRDHFDQFFYNHLNRKNLHLREVMAASSIGWFLADYHWKVLPYLEENNGVIFDHYLADYWVQILGEWKYYDKCKQFLIDMNLPTFDHGHHFYLDVDYDVYLERRVKRLADKDFPHDYEDILPIELYNLWRVQYQKMVDEGLLIKVDANKPAKEVRSDIEAVICDT